MTDHLLTDPRTRRRMAIGILVALALHGAPAAAGFTAFVRATPNFEDEGVQMIAEFADVITATDRSDSEAEAADADAARATPEVKAALSARSTDDLPETDASPTRPEDPELVLAEKKTIERTDETNDQQTTEAMKATEAQSQSAASQAADAPSTMDRTASITAAPAEGSVREAPPTPASWTKAVMAHLGRHKSYPREARAASAEGDVQVALVIARDGRVLERRLHRTGGAPSLDRAALELVDRATPLPALPADFLTDRIEVVVPIRYRLKS